MAPVMSSRERASNQPASIHWNGQKRLAGWTFTEQSAPGALASNPFWGVDEVEKLPGCAECVPHGGLAPSKDTD